MIKARKLIAEIKNYILTDENIEEVVHELKRYRKEFPLEPDYNWYQYGNILPYYSQIRDFYKEHGFYPDVDNDMLLEHFKAHLKIAIDEIIEEHPEVK